MHGTEQHHPVNHVVRIHFQAGSSISTFLLSQPSVINITHTSPIHPEVDNGPGELRSPQDRCGVGTLSLLESSYAASPLKYGAE